jgi:hypothetical protein
VLYVIGTIAPPEQEHTSVNQYFPWLPEWLDLNIVVPIGATVVVIIVGVVVICVALSRWSRGPEQTRLRGNVSFLFNDVNVHQRMFHCKFHNLVAGDFPLIMSYAACLNTFGAHVLSWISSFLEEYTEGRMVSSEMLHCVALVRTDVSEELSASFIRVTRIGELITTLAKP